MTPRHIKLISGEEVLLNVVQYEEDELGRELILATSAYSLIAQEDYENGTRYYTFRPFMMQITDPTHMVSINTDAIICMTIPTDIVKEQYVLYVNHSDNTSESTPEEESEENNSEDKNIIRFNPKKLH